MPLEIAPPTTDIEIISQAAALCGKGTFNTISSGGQFARDGALFYNTLVSAELGSNRWRFALHNQPVGVLTTLDPAFEGWQYYYDLPADCIMLLAVHPVSTDYTVMGRRILTRGNTRMSVTYCRNVPVTLWPPPFSMYIVYALANMLAASITNSDRMVARLQKDLARWESRALFADGQNSPVRSMRNVPWIQARFAFRTQGRGNF